MYNDVAGRVIGIIALIRPIVPMDVKPDIHPCVLKFRAI